MPYGTALAPPRALYYIASSSCEVMLTPRPAQMSMARLLLALLAIPGVLSAPSCEVKGKSGQTVSNFRFTCVLRLSQNIVPDMK